MCIVRSNFIYRCLEKDSNFRCGCEYDVIIALDDIDQTSTLSLVFAQLSHQLNTWSSLHYDV